MVRMYIYSEIITVCIVIGTKYLEFDVEMPNIGLIRICQINYIILVVVYKRYLYNFR